MGNFIRKRIKRVKFKFIRMNQLNKDLIDYALSSDSEWIVANPEASEENLIQNLKRLRTILGNSKDNYVFIKHVIKQFKPKKS